MPRLRVVYLDHCAELSGAELALLRLLPHLDVEPRVILGADGPLVERLEGAGITVEVLALDPRMHAVRRADVVPSVAGAISLARTASYTVRLARRLRALRPDIVHTNSLKAGVYGSMAARLAGIPVVWHVHDRIAEDYLPSPAVKVVRELIHRLPHAVIANSAATLASTTLSEKSSVRARVVPSVVVYDPYQSTARPRPEPDGGFVVGMVGRLAPWKGQDVFLRAFARAFPDGEERALIVGSAMFGEDDYAEGLRQLVEDLGLSARVELTGFREDVVAELDRMHLLVHASTIAEPFGQVIIEGMAAGLPVIASGAGGPAEIITAGLNGELFPVGDVEALARLLRELRDDPDRRAHLRAGAVRRARDFDPTQVVPVVEALYRDIARRDIARRPSKRRA